MDYLIDHYTEIIAVLGVFIGLFSTFGTIYSKNRDSKIKEKELDLKKEQFSLEKKYQISKDKYQKLFEKEINTYQKLYTLTIKYELKKYNIGSRNLGSIQIVSTKLSTPNN